MVAIKLEDIFISSFVTILAAYQLTQFAGRVGAARRRLKVPYPQMTGNEELERYIRAQQNTLEFFPVFMVLLWTSSLFTSQLLSGLFGLCYVISRYQYFNGYIKAVEDRVSGFKLGAFALRGMFTLTVIGMAFMSVKKFQGFDCWRFCRTSIKPHLEEYNLEFLFKVLK